MNHAVAKSRCRSIVNDKPMYLLPYQSEKRTIPKALYLDIDGARDGDVPAGSFPLCMQEPTPETSVDRVQRCDRDSPTKHKVCIVMDSVIPYGFWAGNGRQTM